MTQKRKQITGHMLACGTQIMWGATFVSTKVLLQYFIPVEHASWNPEVLAKPEVGALLILAGLAISQKKTGGSR